MKSEWWQTVPLFNPVVSDFDVALYFDEESLDWDFDLVREDLASYRGFNIVIDWDKDKLLVENLSSQTCFETEFTLSSDYESEAIELAISLIDAYYFALPSPGQLNLFGCHQNEH